MSGWAPRNPSPLCSARLGPVSFISTGALRQQEEECMMRHGAGVSCVLAAVLALAALPAAGQGKPAAEYPNRAVRVIIPQAAGGAVDVAWRPIAQKLTETWGQQVIVDNRPGANGIIGME